ncbi:hypothetical protein IV203_004000 [Nitzschia inconspicua]|uniref:Uncharacterized protein n=1 Tax=Nitzschia inconspicua TaxID=303405 RepID=A0A9K3PRI2_9STRA|nr:hypothetical protein IV203_004000 [Nitzschia inconspicua]
MKGTFLWYSSTFMALAGIIIHQLGFFDRDDFHYYENLWWPDGMRKKRAHREYSVAQPLYAVMAMTATKDFGSHIERLLTNIKTPLEEDDTIKALMAKAAQEYGAPEGSEAMSIGLYFEDPYSVDDPRWGIGWALGVETYEELQAIQEIVAASFQHASETVRAVRIGPGPVLKSRIPWRHMFTPMIMPMIQWKRGFETYDKGQKEGIYKANNGRNNKTDWDAVACEVYVCDRNDKGAYIDYIVLMGDTSVLWNDSFPIENNTNNKVNT